MWRLIWVFAHFFISVLAQGGPLTQCDGAWSTIDIDKCETEIEDAVMTFDVERRRINRTHEIFRANIGATMEIDETFQMSIDICKHMDGGCKPVTRIVDGLEKALNKHAKKNLETAFQLAGIDPPHFPIPKGEHLVDGFMMDYCELSACCQYGKYEGKMYIVKDAKQVGCLKGVVEYAEKEDDSCS